MRNKLQSINRDIERLKGDIEEQETQLSLLMSKEDTAKACQSDISLMDRYLVSDGSKTCFPEAILRNVFLISKSIKKKLGYKLVNIFVWYQTNLFVKVN